MESSARENGCHSSARHLMLRPLIRSPPIAGRPAPDNLFVRLAPQTARRLHDMMTPPPLEGHDLLDGPKWQQQQQAEKVSFLDFIFPSSISATTVSGVEFVPLKITIPDDASSCRRRHRRHHTIYASYNGGDLDLTDYESNWDQEAEECISLPASLLAPNVTCTEHVKVQPIRNVVTAIHLWVEPCTVEDWELVELDAAWLEQGGLLQQVSLVYTGQIVTVRLSHGTTVRLLVLPSQQSSSLQSDVRGGGTEVWPTTNNAPPPCWRLDTTTQVVVVPKPRRHAELLPKSQSLRLFPSRQDYIYHDAALLELAAHVKVDLIDVLQGSAVIHPNTLAKLTTASESTIHNDDSDSDNPLDLAQAFALVENADEQVIVKINTSDVVADDGIVMHPLARMKIKMPMFAPLRDVTIKMLSAFELERLQSVATDQMTKGRIHLDLEPVDLHTQDSSLPPWRRPDSTEKRSMTSQELDLEFRLSQLQLLESFPVQVGCFVSLESNDDARYIVQLVARADSTRQGDAKPMEGFVFSHDLSSLLLPHPPKPANTHSSSRGQNTMEVSHSPSVLQQVLPAESFFSSSLLQLVQEAGLCSDVVLHGERGCGKTFAALAIGAASRLCKGCSIVYQDCRKLRDSQQLRMNDVLAELSALFTDAVESSPCVVILDNLDDLIPSFDSDSSSDDIMQLHQVNPVEVDQAKLIRDVLLEKMRALPSKVKLVVTCRSCDSLSSTILSARNFDLRITLPDVDEPDRGPLFRCLLRQHCPGISTAGRQDAEFARRTVGFRPRDFEQLALRTLTKRGRRNDSRALKDCEIAIELDTFVPISRLGAVSDTSTSASMDDLGGLFRAKNELTSIVSQPIRYHRIYERARIRLPRGILLYGFPGTGKSMCGSALASQCGLPLIMCRGPELLDKYIGASEAKVRDLFARAAAAAPSILFLDEVDAMAPRRGSDHSGVTDRVVNQLLTFLDGVENTSGKGQVYVVATSSRPDKIDPALLRPGRLERHIYFGFAENDVEVSDLLSAVARRFNLDPAASAAITSGDFVETARKESIDFGRFSPADVKAAFSTSQLSAAHEALSSGHTNEKVAISRDHLLQAFRSLRPSLLSSDFDRLGRVYATYRGDKSYEQSTANGEHAKPLMTALK